MLLAQYGRTPMSATGQFTSMHGAPECPVLTFQGSKPMDRRGPSDRAALAPMDIRLRRDLHATLEISLAALLQPCFDLFKVPHDASRREIEAAREFAARRAAR